MAGNNIGKITQIISAVLDIKFQEGHLPEINEAIEVPLKDGGRLVVEVAQHLGDDTVRCIALGPTDGLVRGMDAIATGAPISVPVGEKTLGRLFNVLGDPIDEIAAPDTLPIPLRKPLRRRCVSPPCLRRAYRNPCSWQELRKHCCTPFLPWLPLTGNHPESERCTGCCSRG